MKTTNQFHLMKVKRFAPFFWTQFFGAFNDNQFKNALIILFTYQVGTSTLDSDIMVNLCAGLFILPFFIFSATAGQFADKFEKSRLIRWVKVLEIVIMLLAAYGLYRNDFNFLIFVLFLLGIQSAFFGPVKYSILPQHLRETELVGGNGLVETGTFIAILLGTISGSILVAVNGIGAYIVAGVGVVIALLGWWMSCGIPTSKANAPDLKISWNPITQTWRNIRFARENRSVFLSILGISWFWFYGAVLVAQLPLYSKEFLGGTPHVVTLLLVMFSIGIGVGSLACERLSGHKIEPGLVPLGSIGLSLLAFSLYMLKPDIHHGELINVFTFISIPYNWLILANLALMGLFGGIYIVPLYALIQSRSEATHRSRIIAANNILNALFMVIAALYAIALLALDISIPQLFLITGVINLVVATYIYTLAPEFLMRFLTWIIVASLYRVKVTGAEQHIPDEGPAVLVCNHVSFIDALAIMAHIRRPIRFVMDHSIFKIPVLSFIFRQAKAIPIASAKADPAVKAQAFELIAEALQEGCLVAIFPEGMITKDGELNAFRPGIEQVITRTPVPVIPMALGGLWGSFFSRKYGKAMSSWPKRLWSKITLRVGDPIPPENVSLAVLEQKVLALRGTEK